MGYVLKRQVKYQASSNFASVTLPALFTEKGVLISHLRYLYEKRNKSQSWLERNTFAVELLLIFISQRTHWFSSSTELLRAFVDALSFGTIDDGFDSSNFYWRPRKNEDVNVLLGHITSYCDYLDRINGTELPKLNPMRLTTSAEERLLWCAYYRRKSQCFLNHLKKPSHKCFSEVHEVRGPERHLLSIEPVF